MVEFEKEQRNAYVQAVVASTQQSEKDVKVSAADRCALSVTMDYRDHGQRVSTLITMLCLIALHRVTFLTLFEARVRRHMQSV